MALSRIAYSAFMFSGAYLGFRYLKTLAEGHARDGDGDDRIMIVPYRWKRSDMDVHEIEICLLCDPTTGWLGFPIGRDIRPEGTFKSLFWGAKASARCILQTEAGVSVAESRFVRLTEIFEGPGTAGRITVYAVGGHEFNHPLGYWFNSWNVRMSSRPRWNALSNRMLAGDWVFQLLGRL